ANSTQIGLVISAGLAGASAATAIVAWASTRIGYRSSLVVLSLLAAMGGLGLALLPSFALLTFLSFVGMVNGMGTDRSAMFALEQAIIPGLVSNRERTWALSWYNVLLDSGGALGALGAALPPALRVWTHTDLGTAYGYVFIGYAAQHVVVACLYLWLPAGNELLSSNSSELRETAVSAASRRVVH